MLAVSTLLLLRGTAAQIVTPAIYPVQSGGNAAPPVSKRKIVSDACECDLVRNACDANCCCDEGCSEEEKALFSACSPSAAPLPELNYCLDEAKIAKVPSKFRVIPSQLPPHLMLGLVCSASHDFEMGMHPYADDHYQFTMYRDTSSPSSSFSQYLSSICR
jgi:hypothetical protein